MSSDFRRKVDNMLRDAEFTVASGQPRERHSINRSHYHHDAALAPYPEKVVAAYAGGGAAGAAASSSSLNHHHQRGSSVDWAPTNNNNNSHDPDPVEPTSSAARRKRNGTTDQHQHHPPVVVVGASAAIAALQDEVDELRRELRAERDNRETLMNAVVRRVKEEIRSETIMAARETDHQVAEMAAQLKSRVADIESTTSACARRCDEVTRAVKVCSSDIFELSEQTNDAVSDLRSQVDSAVSLASSTKVDCARSVEKERIALQHRLEVEMARFGETERQQRAGVGQVRERMAEEVRRLATTVDELVAGAWETRAKAFIATVNEALDTVKAQSRTVNASLSDQSSKVDQLTKQVRTLQALDTHVFEQRLAGVENIVPNLSSRVDRTEKRSEALLDSNSRLTASVDVLREAADRAAAHAVRCVERLQTFEGTLSDRDGRLASVESALVHVQGAERVKTELESVKRSMSRVESVAEAMRSNSQRDERIVENLERAVDALQAKADSAEARHAKTAAKCEALEQRVAQSGDRALAVEASVDRMGTSITQHANELATSVGVLTRRSDGLEAKVAAQLEQHEAIVCDVRNRAMQVESTCNAMRITVESAVQSAASARGEADKLLRKVSSLEATTHGLADFASTTAARNSGNSASEQQLLQQRFNDADTRMNNITSQFQQLRSTVEVLSKNTATVAQRQEQQMQTMASSRGGSGADSLEIMAAVSKLTTTTDQLQNSNTAIRSQLASVEGRLANVEEDRSRSRSPPPAPASGSGSGSGTFDANTRFDSLEQGVKVIKSQANLSSQRIERVEALLGDVEERIDMLEDNLNRISAVAGSSKRAATVSSGSNAAAAAGSESAGTAAEVVVAPRVIVSSSSSSAAAASSSAGGGGSITTVVAARGSAAPSSFAAVTAGGMMAPEPTPRSAVSGLSPMSASDESPRAGSIGAARQVSPTALNKAQAATSSPHRGGTRGSPSKSTSTSGNKSPSFSGQRGGARSPTSRSPSTQQPRQQREEEKMPVRTAKKQILESPQQLDASASMGVAGSVGQIMATVGEAWGNKSGADNLAKGASSNNVLGSSQRLGSGGNINNNNNAVKPQSFSRAQQHHNNDDDDDELDSEILMDEAPKMRPQTTAAPFDNAGHRGGQQQQQQQQQQQRHRLNNDNDEYDDEEEEDDRRSDQHDQYGRGTPLPDGILRPSDIDFDADDDG